jgi:hypothetical protein
MPRNLRLALLLVFAAVLVAELVAMRRTPRAVDPRARHARTVMISEQALRDAFALRVRRMLAAERFDALEALADSLRRDRTALPSGAWYYAVMFGDGFGEVDEPGGDERWSSQLAALREWGEQHPDPAAPRLALASALIGRAWAARGGGYRNSVREQEWARFRSDLEEAAQILDQCPEAAKTDYVWYFERLQTLHGLGHDQDPAYRALFDEASDAFPERSNLYVSMARHLMPRWYGEPGDWLRFAGACVDSLPEPLGAEMYARIVVDQCRFEPKLFADPDPPAWPVVRRGLLAWHARWPASPEPLTDLAQLAALTGHRTDARMAFAALGDTVDADRWDSWAEYDRARAWANDRGVAEAAGR